MFIYMKYYYIIFIIRDYIYPYIYHEFVITERLILFFDYRKHKYNRKMENK